MIVKAPQIVLLQGPPGCGKDTIASILAEGRDYSVEKFAQPIRDYLEGVWGVDLQYNEHLKNSIIGFWIEGCRSTKTVRDLMIAYSETFLKPLFGQDVFGLLATERTSRSGFYVFSDSGFPAEAEPIIAKFGLENCVTIQVSRSHCSFTGDSRSYWTRPGLRSFSFYNSAADLVELEESFLTFWDETLEAIASKEVQVNA